jgi:hypothetical protein
MTLSLTRSCGFEWTNNKGIMALEERRRGLREVLAVHLPGGTKENHKNLSQVKRCPDRELNRAPPKYESIALPATRAIRLEVFRLWICYYSRDSSVGIVTEHELVERGSISARGKRFLLHRVQTGTGAHTASYPMSTAGDFPGIKAAGA